MLRFKRKNLLGKTAVVALCASLLTGYTVSAKAPAGTQSGAAESKSEVTYPLKDNRKLSVWSSIMKPHSSFVDYTESPFHIGLKENTGIDVEWIYTPAGTDQNQAFNLMLASNTLPDIIMHTMMTDADRYMDEKVIRDITEYLPAEAPNYWNFLQSNQLFDKSMKADSGRYYGFGVFRDSQWASVYTGPVIRKDWLDECGLPIPETIEDWEITLEAFKKEYGVGMAFALTRMNPGIAGAFGAYGSFAAWAGSMFYVDDDGQIQLSMAQPEWKDQLSTMSEWYKAGYLDPDTFTLDDAAVRTKALQGKMGISVTSMGQMSNWIADAAKDNLDAEWVGIPYPVQNKGDINPTIQMEDLVRTHVGVVTTSCAEAKIPLALRWLDYFFSDEGFMYINFGTDGDTYKMVKGEPVFTDKILKAPEGVDQAMQKYLGTITTGLGVQASAMVKQKNNAASVAAVDIWLKNQEAVNHIIPSAVTKTTDESNDSNEALSAITTYVQEMSLKFLTGEESLDKFDQYLANLDSIGLQKVLEINQQAYERFLER